VTGNELDSPEIKETAGEINLPITDNVDVSGNCLSNAMYCYLFRFPFYYPRDAMLARVFAIATCLDVCPSVRPSVCHTPVLCVAERKQDREMYTI